MSKQKPLSVQPMIDSLIKNDIDYSEVFDLIKALPKPWHRPEWKELREKLIKDYCEKCGSKEPPFVIQHLLHPTQFREIKAEAMQKFSELHPELIVQIKVLRENKLYQALFKVLTLAQFNDVRLNAYVNNVLDSLSSDVTDMVNEAAIIRDCCPECSRLVTIRHYRKTWKKYKCDDGHIFETPSKIIWYKKYRTKDKDEAIRSAKIDVLRRYKNPIDKKIYELSKEIDSQVGKEAMLKAFEEHTIYISMKHSKAYCKNCAYVEDYKNGLVS